MNGNNLFSRDTVHFKISGDHFNHSKCYMYFMVAVINDKEHVLLYISLLIRMMIAVTIGTP